MNLIFNVVYRVLLWFSSVTGFSYEEVNIITYYFVVPLVFLLLLDRIVKKHVFAPCFVVAAGLLLVFTPSFRTFSHWLFERSVDFLMSFDRVGLDYTAASVVICVLLPEIVFAILFCFAYPKVVERHLPTVSRFLARLRKRPD